jgi:hypothetical protein
MLIYLFLTINVNRQGGVIVNVGTSNAVYRKFALRSSHANNYIMARTSYFLIRW